MIDVYICEDNIEQRKSFVHYVQAAIMIEEYDMCCGWKQIIQTD